MADTADTYGLKALLRAPTATPPDDVLYVSDAARARLTLATPYSLIIFDFNSTLITPITGKVFPRDERDYTWMQGREAKLRALRADGVTVGVATNQGGAAYGYLNPKVWAEHALRFVHWASKAIGEGEPFIDALAVCFHHPQGTNERLGRACPWRKPEPNMLLALMAATRTPTAYTLFVGDRREDEEAATRAGVDFSYADDYFR